MTPHEAQAAHNEARLAEVYPRRIALSREVIEAMSDDSHDDLPDLPPVGRTPPAK